MNCIISPKGQTIKGGYKRHYYKGRTELAHRAAYEDKHGPIPTGLVVRHKCDNPPCINPDHLELGTQKQNVADCYERGRAVDIRGVEHHNARLTEEVVLEIKRLQLGYYSGQDTELSRRYGVTRSNIGLIRRGKAWKHVRLESTCENT